MVVVSEVEWFAWHDWLPASPAVDAARFDLSGCGFAFGRELCPAATMVVAAAFGFVFPVVLGAVAAYGDVWASRLGADAFGACHVCLPA